MIDDLERESRLIIDATLRPVLGSTFQPTGFANLGAAEFRRSDDSTSLLVESVQSLTNHFEALGFDAAAHAPIELLADLPWIDVRSPDGDHLTSSREEPHRLAAAYVNEAQIEGQNGLEWVRDFLGLRPRQPLDWRAIYGALLELDPLCLLHGVFFSRKEYPGNPKVRRALSAVIEAHGVTPVQSGGLKRDDVQFTAGETGQRAEEGYGFVPFGRTEYTADEIRFSAVLDLTQLRGYGLDPAASRLLTLIGVWQMVGLLDEPLRLRTACDLEVQVIDVRRPASFALPSRDALEEAIAHAARKVPFGQPGARLATWPAPKAS